MLCPRHTSKTLYISHLPSNPLLQHLLSLSYFVLWTILLKLFFKNPSLLLTLPILVHTSFMNPTHFLVLHPRFMTSSPTARFERQVVWGCGGALITARYVITAGHCTASEFTFNRDLWVCQLGSYVNSYPLILSLLLSHSPSVTY